jgi:hypothetical protein
VSLANQVTLETDARLSIEEWEMLARDEMLLRWEKATILREAYTSRPAVIVLMDKEGEKKFLSEFNRIGNNINQLAKKANSGECVSDEQLMEIRDQFKVLYRFVMRFDGVR